MRLCRLKGGDFLCKIKEGTMGRWPIITLTAIVFLFLWASPSLAQKEGEAIFKAKDCGSCHSISPPKFGSIEEKMNEKGPNLSYAGSKYKEEWLKKWLAKPENIHYTKYNTLSLKPDKHVAIPEKEAGEVAKYLSTLKDAKVVSGAVSSGGLMGGEKVKAKTLFDKKKACYACHTVKTTAGKLIGGRSGPDLSMAGERLNGDWVYSYLKAPDHFEPKGRSPVFALSDDEAKKIAAYVVSFK